MPPDTESVLTKFYLKPEALPSEKTQRSSKTMLRRNGHILNVSSPTFKDLMRVRSEGFLNEVSADTESTRRFLTKKSYRLVSESLCDPFANSVCPQRFNQDQYPFVDDGPEFDFFDATSHLIEKNDAGLTQKSSLEDHEPYVLTEDELDFLEEPEAPDSLPTESKFKLRERWVEDISKPEYPYCGWAQEEVLGWSNNPPEKISSYERRWVKYPQKPKYPYCGWRIRTFRVWSDNPEFKKNSIKRNRFVHPNNRKLMQSIICAERNKLRNQIAPEAHRVKAMLTITAVARRKEVAPDKFEPQMIDGEEVIVYTPPKTRMIPSQSEIKSYLHTKLNLLYKVLSELDQQIPFNQIPNADCANFICVYEDKRRTEQGKVVWAQPHLHILILDDVSSLIDPDRLAILLARISGRKSKKFDLPKIHLKFPTGGSAHEEYLRNIHIPDLPPDFVPLREQRIRMIRYVTKYMWQEQSSWQMGSGMRWQLKDDDWKLMSSQDFQKTYFNQSEKEGIEKVKTAEKEKWRMKRSIKTKIRNDVVRELHPIAKPRKDDGFSVEVIRTYQR